MDAERLKSKRKELTARLGALRADRAANERRRRDLALDAELGDATARKGIVDLSKAAAALEVDISNAEAAFVEAGRRIMALEVADRDDVERENARQALALLETFRARGAALDAAFGAALDEYLALTDEFRRLGALGFAPTTPALVSVNMKLAAQTKLLGTGLEAGPLRAHEKRDFVSSIEAWATFVERKAEGRLNRAAAKAA